jgi:hypothetical protein
VTTILTQGDNISPSEMKNKNNPDDLVNPACPVKFFVEEERSEFNRSLPR